MIEKKNFNKNNNKSDMNEIIWFQTLVSGEKCLLNVLNIIDGNIIIRQRTWREVEVKKEKNNWFTAFKGSRDLYEYVIRVPTEARDIYEMIDGDKKQKPHFDIDIKFLEEKLSEDEATNIYNKIIEEIRNVSIKILGKELKEIGFKHYPSHGSDKRSGHIIFSKCHHNNATEAKLFCDTIKYLMTPELAKYIDPKVYSSRQNFRCLYCAKLGTQRIKILEGSTEVSFTDFTDSLVSEIAPDSFLIEIEKLPKIPGKAIPKVILPSTYNSQEVDMYAIANMAMDMTAAFSGVTQADWAFEFSKIQGTLIILKRRWPSYCSLHGRIHDNENPYLGIVNGRSVYFHCRCDPPKKIYIGDVGNNYSSSSPPESKRAEVKQEKKEEVAIVIKEKEKEEKPLPDLQSFMNQFKQKPISIKRIYDNDVHY